MAGHPPTQKLKDDEQDGVSTTLLHIAALEGDVNRLRSLLQQKGIVDAPDQELKTPLHIAIQCETPSITLEGSLPCSKSAV